MYPPHVYLFLFLPLVVELSPLPGRLSYSEVCKHFKTICGVMFVLDPIYAVRLPVRSAHHSPN